MFNGEPKKCYWRDYLQEEISAEEEYSSALVQLKIHVIQCRGFNGRHFLVQLEVTAQESQQLYDWTCSVIWWVRSIYGEVQNFGSVDYNHDE